MAGTAIKDRLRDLTTALQAKEAALAAVTNAIEVDGSNVAISTEQRADFRKNLADAQEIKALIKDLEGARDVGDFLASAPDGNPVAGDEAVEAERKSRELDLRASQQSKSLGQLVTESEQYKVMRATASTTMVPYVYTGSLVDDFKDVYTAMAGNLVSRPALGSAVNIVERAFRNARVRDLFPADRTNQSVVDYIRVTGFTNAARPVAERTAADGVAAGNVAFGLKPKSDLTFVAEQARVITIAHIIDAHRNALADEPRLRGIIDREMMYGLQLVEDQQILWGSGTGENLRGIFNTSGTQAYTQYAGAAGPPVVPPEYKATAIRRALTRVMLAQYEPTGIVLHPFDWEDIELAQDTQGRYLFVANVAIGADRRLWRLPVVETPAMTEGRFLAGAFGLGARIYDREDANVQISTENRDNFERNVISIRAEERIGMSVDRPESFVVGTFTTTT